MRNSLKQGFYYKPDPGYRHPSTESTVEYRVPGYFKYEIKKKPLRKKLSTPTKYLLFLVSLKPFPALFYQLLATRS